ncbi:integrase catalytic domain-containing protein [Trichonephila clavipes]|nr:integrase catalytic domain-containing protein [Trichonephila clavipes]
MAADISSCEEYKDRGIDLKTKLHRQIEILSDRQEIRTGGPSTVNRDNTIYFRNETKTVKLPKLNILQGDCSRFLDSWNSFEVAIHNNDSLT